MRARQSHHNNIEFTQHLGVELTFVFSTLLNVQKFGLYILYIWKWSLWPIYIYKLVVFYHKYQQCLFEHSWLFGTTKHHWFFCHWIYKYYNYGASQVYTNRESPWFVIVQMSVSCWVKVIMVSLVTGTNTYWETLVKPFSNPSHCMSYIC